MKTKTENKRYHKRCIICSDNRIPNLRRIYDVLTERLVAVKYSENEAISFADMYSNQF